MATREGEVVWKQEMQNAVQTRRGRRAWRISNTCGHLFMQHNVTDSVEDWDLNFL